MKLSTKGRYAVTAMMDLAINHRTGPMSLADISKNQSISLSYLEQIFSKLRKADLVEGVRGPGGGYRLARPINQITIAQIILAADVSIDSTQCLGAEDCSGGDRCLTHKLWEDLSFKLYEFLNDITLADFVKEPKIRHLRMPQDSPSNYINNMFLPISRAS